MRRYELSDAQWARIEPLLPKNRPHKPGRHWHNHRPLVQGILWRLHSGAPWRDIPERYGPWQTIYNRFNRWRQDGTWDKILAHLLDQLDQAGRISRALWLIDASVIRATRAAAGAGKKDGPPVGGP
jgi:transposase